MGRCGKEFSVSSLSGRRIRTVVGVSVFLPPILQFTLIWSRNGSPGVSFGFSGLAEKQGSVMRYPSCELPVEGWLSGGCGLTFRYCVLSVGTSVPVEHSIPPHRGCESNPRLSDPKSHRGKKKTNTQIRPSAEFLNSPLAIFHNNLYIICYIFQT